MIIPSTTLDLAMAMFRYREEAAQRLLPCDLDWERVLSESVEPALAGERGKTDQQQCAYQAIRITVFASGQVLKPWTKAFLPPPPIVAPEPVFLPPAPVAWRERWRQKVLEWYRAILKRINDLF